MIDDIRLQNFRSYEDASFEFGPGVNIIVGPNGSGKTNLIEAIQFVSTGTSYRVSDGDLVRFGAPWLRVDASLDEGKVTRVAKILTDPLPSKQFEIQDKTYRRLTTPNTLPLVLFEPNHLQLLHGSPELRRTYLDDISERTTPGFGVFRRNYKRVLAQRNALLKQKSGSALEFFPWNLRLSELAAVIVRSRTDLAAELTDRLHELYGILSGDTTKVTLQYTPQFPIEAYESQLLRTLEASLTKDMHRGFTAYGPHREDFTVFFDGHPAADVASRGETRTVILALKILELELLEAARNTPPLLLLDDVFSELDGARRRALTSYLKTHQTFLTTTDADVVVKHFTDSTIIPLV